MARYFFDIDDGGIETIDDTGVEFETDEKARNAALAALPGIAKGVLDHDAQELQVCVRNEKGRSFFKAKLALSAKWL